MKSMSTNYLHVNQQSHSDFRGTPSISPKNPSGQQAGSSLLPELLSTFAFAWQRTDTVAYSGKGFLVLRGVGYQRKGSCWQLTYLQHTFSKPGWSSSLCLPTAEIAGRGLLLLWSHVRNLKLCKGWEDTDLPVEIRCGDQRSSIWKYNLSFLPHSLIHILPWVQNGYPQVFWLFIISAAIQNLKIFVGTLRVSYCF